MFRNYDGQISIFNLDGHCPNVYLINTIVNDDYTINNTLGSPQINNNYVVDYHANNTLYASNFKIGSAGGGDNSEVYFRAGNKIIVRPGANGSAAYSGSKFHAKIDPGLYCNDPFLRTQPGTPKPSMPSYPATLNNPTPVAKTTNYLTAGISPNPNNGTFILHSEETTPGKISIYNNLGQTMYQSATVGPQTAIDISSHPKGIYILKVQAGEKVYTEKLIVQ